MPTYYLSATIPRGDVELVGVSGGPTAALMRVQNYVDTTSSGGSRIQLGRLNTPGTLSNLTTPEKANTRSPTKQDSYYLNGGTVAVRHVLVALSLATFNPSGWTSKPKYSVSCIDTDGLIAELATVTVTAMVYASFEENLEGKNWIRGCMRRSTKRGYWPMLGNGGIFRYFASTINLPLSQNDHVFVDQFPWRLGWSNPGIVTDSRRQRTLVGVGQ